MALVDDDDIRELALDPAWPRRAWSLSIRDNFNHLMNDENSPFEEERKCAVLFAHCAC